MSKLLRAIDGTYQALLWLYPRGFRGKFGPLIAQAFRDQCRDACREHGGLGLLCLLPKTFYDLLRSSVHEHLLNQHPMKMFQTPQRASNVLLIAGLAAGFVVTGAFYKIPFMFLASCYLVGAIFLARAIAEWKRPHADWWKGILTAVVIFVAYGLFMPAWAKLRATHNLEPATLAPSAFIPMAATLLVALAKTGLHFLQRRQLS